jgi:hypothetical protein
VRRAKKKLTAPPKLRNPVARSPLLAKGAAHGKTTGARRRAATVSLAKSLRDPEALE